MTVVQALAQPGPTYASLSDRAARRWRDRQGRIYRRSRACCAASSWVARSIRDDYEVDPGRVHVVGLGHSARVRRVQRDWTTPRFIFVGMDWERKRGDAVVEAFASVRRHHPAASLAWSAAIRRSRLRASPVTATSRSVRSMRAGDSRICSPARPAWWSPPSTSRSASFTWKGPRPGFPASERRSAVRRTPWGTVVVSSIPGIRRRCRLRCSSSPIPLPRSGWGRRRVHGSRFSWHAVAERLLRALRPAGVEISTLASFLETQAQRRSS